MSQGFVRGGLFVDIGDITLSGVTVQVGYVNQGNPAPFSSGWPVEITDGTNLLGIPGHPLAVSGIVNIPNTLNVNVVSAPDPLTVNGAVSVSGSLPSGSNQIGHVVTDTGSTTTITGNVNVVQTTGSNLHVAVDSLPGPVSVTGTVDIGSMPPVTVAVSGIDNIQGSVNVSGWLGSTAPTVGSKTSANSIPVVIASDQSAVAVTGTVTASIPNPLTVNGSVYVSGNPPVTISNFPTVQTVSGVVMDMADGTSGSPASLIVQQIGGQDRAGNLQPIGVAVPGTPAPLTAVLVGGTGFAGNIRTFTLNSTDDVNVALNTAAGNPINFGQQADAGSLPVVIASNQSTIPVSVQNFPNPITVNGTVAISGDSVTLSIPSPVTVNGAVTISGSPTVNIGTMPSVTVSGVDTVNQGSPTVNSSGWPVKITDGTNSVAIVSGTPTAGQNALLTESLMYGFLGSSPSRVQMIGAPQDLLANSSISSAITVTPANMVFNGTTWDRMRSPIQDAQTASGMHLSNTSLYVGSGLYNRAKDAATKIRVQQSITGGGGTTTISVASTAGLAIGDIVLLTGGTSEYQPVLSYVKDTSITFTFVNGTTHTFATWDTAIGTTGIQQGVYSTAIGDMPVVPMIAGNDPTSFTPLVGAFKDNMLFAGAVNGPLASTPMGWNSTGYDRFIVASGLTGATTTNILPNVTGSAVGVPTNAVMGIDKTANANAYRILNTDANGNLRVQISSGAAGSAATGLGSDALSPNTGGLFAVTMNEVFNGTAYERARSISAINPITASGTGVTAVGITDGTSRVVIGTPQDSALQQGVTPALATNSALYASDGSAFHMLKTAPGAAGILSINTEGTKATYSAAITDMSVASPATDIFTITGSASKTVRVTRLEIDAIASGNMNIPVQLIKRSSADAGGTSTAPTMVPADSNDAGATATITAYTVNPSGLGASVGVYRNTDFTVPASGSPTVFSVPEVWDFTNRNAKGIVLRGASQQLSVNLNNSPTFASRWSINCEWTEE